MNSRFSHPARLHLPSNTDRALRLRREAANCIAVALEAANDPFAAELIDEAARLSDRARQIGCDPIEDE